MGYHRAGFDVVGVDIRPQPRYPFEFIQADAMTFPLGGFDAIHASPPCQAYSLMLNRFPASRSRHADLVEPMRTRLTGTTVPWVIENVVGAPLQRAIRLCGSHFGLGTVRHRVFESSELLMAPPCDCKRWRDHAGVFGAHPDGGKLWERKDGHAPQRRAASLKDGQIRMGIDWMEWNELTQAIPPAYTEFIGRQLMVVLEAQPS